MVPDIDLQLRVVMKALRDVVAPALDPNNRLAAEQLGLSLATLGMVQARLPLLQEATRRELANAIDVAKAAAEAGASGLDAALGAGRATLSDPGASAAALTARKRALLDATSAALNRDESPVTRRAIDRAVLSASKAQCDLARAWCLSAGFEPDPHEVPPLETAITKGNNNS